MKHNTSPAREGMDMDFMVCYTGYMNGRDSVWTEWLKAHNEQEAISMAQRYDFSDDQTWQVKTSAAGRYL